MSACGSATFHCRLYPHTLLLLLLNHPPALARCSHAPTISHFYRSAKLPFAGATAAPVLAHALLLLPISDCAAQLCQLCRHEFCYFCLSANCAADRWYECPLDGMRVAAMKRWQPEVQ